MRKVYDPGSGHAAEIAELESTRRRLREDRQAGLYDEPEDAEWYRAEYTAPRGGDHGAESAAGAEARYPGGARGADDRAGMGSGGQAAQAGNAR